MDILAVFIPLFPAIAAAVIGIGHLFRMLDGEARETTTAGIASVGDCAVVPVGLGAARAVIYWVRTQAHPVSVNGWAAAP